MWHVLSALGADTLRPCTLAACSNVGVIEKRRGGGTRACEQSVSHLLPSQGWQDLALWLIIAAVQSIRLECQSYTNGTNFELRNGAAEHAEACNTIGLL